MLLKINNFSVNKKNCDSTRLPSKPDDFVNLLKHQSSSVLANNMPPQHYHSNGGSNSHRRMKKIRSENLLAEDFNLCSIPEDALPMISSFFDEEPICHRSPGMWYWLNLITQKAFNLKALLLGIYFIPIWKIFWWLRMIYFLKKWSFDYLQFIQHHIW